MKIKTFRKISWDFQQENYFSELQGLVVSDGIDQIILEIV